LLSDVLGRVDVSVLDVGPIGPGLGLPAPALELPRQELGLPQPRDARAGRSGAGTDLRGLYTGRVSVDGVGSARFTLEITRQRRGRITGRVSSPLLDEAISGTVRVVFTGNRRFTIRLADGDSDAVLISGRFNRNGTVTGSFSGAFGGESLSGTFTLEKVGGPGTGARRFE
jgi:hypothetical protein